MSAYESIRAIILSYTTTEQKMITDTPAISWQQAAEDAVQNNYLYGVCYCKRQYKMDVYDLMILIARYNQCEIMSYFKSEGYILFSNLLDIAAEYGCIQMMCLLQRWDSGDINDATIAAIYSGQYRAFVYLYPRSLIDPEAVLRYAIRKCKWKFMIYILSRTPHLTTYIATDRPMIRFLEFMGILDLPGSVRASAEANNI